MKKLILLCMVLSFGVAFAQNYYEIPYTGKRSRLVKLTAEEENKFVRENAIKRIYEVPEIGEKVHYGFFTEEGESDMIILKEEIQKILLEGNYQKKLEYEDKDLNDFYNYWCFLEQKENEIQNSKNLSIDSILYTKYYWCTRYKDRYEQLYGFDAGIEQQQYKIIEELQTRISENLDWNTLNLIEQNKI